MLPTVVCEDCPAYMKDVLVKYHRPDPVKAFNDTVMLGANFAKVPKYYLSTKNDKGRTLRAATADDRENGTVRKVYELKRPPAVCRPTRRVRQHHPGNQ